MKKILSFVVMLSILLCMVIPYNANANEKAKITYQQAIENAKNAFNLDTKDCEISHRYRENEAAKGYYDIDWTRKDNKWSVTVSVDAMTGEIVNMNSYDASEYSGKRIPKYSNAEALKAAEDFIKKIQPQKLNQMKLAVNEYTKASSYIEGRYYFNFTRVVNGIEFIDNGIKIEVCKNTLKIGSYQYAWDDSQLPDVSKEIGLEKAKEIFKDKLGIELSYRLVTKPGAKQPTPILVYALKNGNNPIDALTGEVMKGNNYIGLEFARKSDSKNYGGDITPEELISIEENSKLISKDAAISVVGKYILQLKDFNLASSNLYSVGNGGAAKWVFYWNYNKKENGTTIYASIDAEVDAVNSKLISFYIYGDKFFPETKTEPVYSEDQSKVTAEKFLKEIEPDKFNQCEYRDLYRNVSNEKPTQYNFYYIRKYDGAVCPFNTISVSVNAYTGQIMSYNCSWKEYTLPTTKTAIKLEDAYKTLFEKVDFSLKYIRVHNYDSGTDKYDIKLAYVIDNNFIMLDSANGELLDYNGKPLKKISTLSFTDIKGTPYEKNIMLLMELGIIDGNGGKFTPNAEILQKDFIKFVMKSIDPYVGDNAEINDYDAYYKEAIERKLISEAEKKPDSKVTRLQASKILIRALGFGGVAELSDIYYFNTKDLKSIPKDMIGYAVLSSRLGIIKLNNGNFNPSSTLKRGETTSMIINYLNVDLTAVH